MHKRILMASIMVLSACASRVGGSSAQETKPIPETKPTPETKPEPTIVDPIARFDVVGNKEALKDSIVLKADGKFYYVIDGMELKIGEDSNSLMNTLSYISSDNQKKFIVLSTRGSAYNYSYMNFGNIFKGDNPTQAQQVGTYFYGVPTTQMPVVGQATYKGLLWGNQGDFTDIKLSVDYGNKTIQGSTGGLSTLTQEIVFAQGNISGNTFSGKTHMVGQELSTGGNYSGMFFGPKAEELGGITTISPELGSQKFSFGAKKQ